jgi:hypothetical protein
LIVAKRSPARGTVGAAPPSTRRAGDSAATVDAISRSRPSTNAVTSALAASLSASRHSDSAARRYTPSIIAAIIAAIRPACSAGTSFASEAFKVDSVRR